MPARSRSRLSKIPVRLSKISVLNFKETSFVLENVKTEFHVNARRFSRLIPKEQPR